ncbi:MAG: SH3 domain-containing protein [Spirochaetes bacterium]|nr:SH3 domain-containing protein [Spirochaetota bacterium]
MKKYYIAILIILITSSLFSCRRKEEIIVVDLPPVQVLEQRTNFAVIMSPHLRLRTEPSVQSRAIITLWRGYILEIVSRSPRRDTVDGKEDFWYQISFSGLRGWVFGAHIMLVPSLERAREEALKLKQ